MSAALDVDHCAGCAAVQICTRWNPNGSWDYRKGIEPCRPVPYFDCPPKSAKRDCIGCQITNVCHLDRDMQTRKYRSRIIIKEEPIISSLDRIPLKPIAPVLDAEESQRNRFRIRDLK